MTRDLTWNRKTIDMLNSLAEKISDCCHGRMPQEVTGKMKSLMSELAISHQELGKTF